MERKVFDYASITESPGLKATREQFARLYHRYRFALDFVRGKDVLEVACGSGIGLGLLAKHAKRIEGGDIDKKNISVAADLNRHDGIEIREMDAHALPYEKNSFDVVLLFEAIYYMEHPEVFVKEAYRILRRQGVLIICTVNRDWEDFHPSLYTYQYFSVPELYSILNKHFSTGDLFGAFSVDATGFKSWLFSRIKHMAVHLDLIPGSLAARAYLKRIFIGPLKPLPDQIYEDMAPYVPPDRIPHDQPNRNYKIIYAVARKDRR
jgi:SAM-dependent methyltransferase